MKFTRLPETAFQNLQLNAGILAMNFDPATGEVKESDLLGATSGGVNFVASAEYSDYGEDIDNAPVNVKEFKRRDSWTVTMSGTFISVNQKLLMFLIASADIDENDPTHIIPRNDVITEDFKDVWWIGDYSDYNGDENGGFLAIHMLNSLSTGGINIQSNNRGKGTFEFEFTGHYSLEDQTRVPFEVYLVEGAPEPATAAEIKVIPQASAIIDAKVNYNKKASDLISADTKILEDGTVKGTLKYVEGFKEYSSVTGDQKGNYFPVKLDAKYDGQEITVTKTGASPKKANDTVWIIRVPDSKTTVEFKQGESAILTLNFEKATLEAAKEE